MIISGIVVVLFVLWLIYEVRNAPVLNKDKESEIKNSGK